MRIISVSNPHAASQPTPLSDDAWEISAGRHLVYARRTEDLNIWRARLPADGDSPAATERFISSTRADNMPKYSPDGRRIVFYSARSGSAEIWVAKADGSDPVRMTFFGGVTLGIMNWSPDGQWIVFHARPEGQADLFVIPAAGGSPKRLTTDHSDDTAPSYSHDGRWIYFTGTRTGQSQIWKMPAAGGEPVQLTTSGGAHSIESPDGQTIFYRGDRDVNEIWTMPVNGGDSVKVAGPTHSWPFGFVVTAEGVYYPAPPHSGELRFIRFLNFSTGQSRPVVLASYPFSLGMSVSPDGVTSSSIKWSSPPAI